MSRKKDSPHAKELLREMETNEAEHFQDDEVAPYPGVRYQDTPAREEALLKSIYADRDTRTFAEMSIVDDTTYSGEEDVCCEAADGETESNREEETDFDSGDLAGRAALSAVRDHLNRESGGEKPAGEKIAGSASQPRSTFFIPEEAEPVVTASGKVIETDTEEIRRTIEKKRAEYSRIPDEELSVREQMDRRKSREAAAPPKREAEKKPYVFPPLDLLKKGKPLAGRSEQVYKDTAIKLQQTLRNFGVGVTVTNISLSLIHI